MPDFGVAGVKINGYLCANFLKRMYKLIIFDFDGTLADTRELIIRTNQESQKAMGHEPVSEDIIQGTIGLPLAEGIMAQMPELTPQDMPAWCATYRRIFDVLKSQYVPAIFPHVKETLEALHSQGCVLSVASSRLSVSLNDFLRQMGLAPLFKLVLGADNVTAAKPDPAPVLQTMQELGFTPEDTLVVGDMPVDILMGSRAGAKTCGVTFGNSCREELTAAGADYVIDDMSKLLEL